MLKLVAKQIHHRSLVGMSTGCNRGIVLTASLAMAPISFVLTMRIILKYDGINFLYSS